MEKKHPKQAKVSDKMRAAYLVAAGMPYKEVAEVVKFSEAAVKNWFSEPNVEAEYLRLVRADIYPDYARAKAKLNSQLDSNNEWVSQNAARDIVGRTEKFVLKPAERQEIVVRLVGAPELGVPDAGDEDEPEPEPEDDS